MNKLMNQIADELGELSSKADQCRYLYELYHRDLDAFFKFVGQDINKYMPIIYTPTVAEAVVNYSKWPMPDNFRGLIISYDDKDHISELLAPYKGKVDIAVVTDGEGVLGIGDQGVGAINISIGKLMVYTLCAGIDAKRVLPIMLDVGTNNETLLNAPEYRGLRRKRLARAEYDEFIASFVQEFSATFPEGFLHWEDFGRDNASRVLEQYRTVHPSFNDDVQGTGVVALAAVLSGVRQSGMPLEDHKICILGAGTAGTGIANQICNGFSALLGTSPAHVAESIFLVDINGLVFDDAKDLTEAQKPFAKSRSLISNWEKASHGRVGLLEVVQNAKPSILIGCSTSTGAFNEEVLGAMASNCERPLIMPLSNPTHKAEATAEEIVRFTKGRALIATGSPFDDVMYEGELIKVSQCNNSLGFPGIGLGMVTSGARQLTDGMLLAAGQALADYVHSQEDDERLLPALDEALPVSQAIAEALAEAGRNHYVQLIIDNG